MSHWNFCQHFWVLIIHLVPLQELELRWMLWERLQREHALNNVCNQTNGWARHHRRGDVETRTHKSRCGGTGVGFLSFIKRSVCQSHLVLSVNYHSLFFIIWVKTNIGCVFFPAALLYGWGYTQFVCCLLRSKTRRVSSRGSWSLAIREHLPLRMLCFRRVLWRWSFHQRPHGASPAFAEADQRLRSWELQTKPHQFQKNETRRSACLSPRSWM